jgi:hypothetical protein
LQHFEPLWPAEMIVLRAAADGAIAKVGLRRPRGPEPDTRLRAEFLSFLARGGGVGARVGGRQLQVVGACIEGRLALAGASVPMSVWLYRCRFSMAPQLDGARIAGSLSFADCSLPGLNAETCRIDGDLALNAGCNIDGEVILTRATLGRNLNCDRMRLGGSEQAGRRVPGRLVADSARIAGSVLLSGGFEAVGEVQFMATHICGDFRAGNAHLTADLDASGARGVALNLDRLRVGGSVFLGAGFSAAGQVSLQQARIEGDLDCSGAAFDAVGDASWGDHSAALLLDRARIGGSLNLRHLQDPLQGASLADARVGALIDDASTWGRHHVLDGFEYKRFAGGATTDALARLDWLGRQTATHLREDFRPDPWRRLISVLRRTGHGTSARDVAIGRELHLRRAGMIGLDAPPSLRWLASLAHDLFGLVAGYGHRPLRLLVAAGAVWLLCGGLYWAAAEHGALAPSAALSLAEPRLAQCLPDCSQLPSTMPRFQPLVYSLDVLVPLIDLQQERHWAPVRDAWASDADSWGAPVLILTWLEASFGWIISLTLLATFTGLTDRDRRNCTS